ncbi:MAG: CopG family transcriptional regulator [Clostridiales bacterium 43-6]|nr:MAG: CopG family transcriptional regulator [Clostridiales bacterium 43-6]
MGRPTDNPKATTIKFRIDEETIQKLDECSKKLNISKSEVLRNGVHRIHGDLKK